MKKIILYEELLHVWSERYNLIGRNVTVEKLIKQSALMFEMLLHYKKDDMQIIDIGSGAGFPGIIWSILCEQDEKHFQMNLVERSLNRSIFLRNCIHELKLQNTYIYMEDIHKFQLIKEYGTLVITAKAFASVVNILFCTEHIWINYDRVIIVLLKTSHYIDEISNAKQKYDLKYDIHEMQYGVILILECISKKYT